MRTVSFSNPDVRQLAKNKFVCTYTNTVGDPTSGQSISHRPSDPPGTCIRGNGKQNVQTIFVTPQGEVFHVATGFLDGSSLAEEMRFADELFQKIKRPGRNENRSLAVTKAHRQRLEKAGFTRQQIESRPGSELMTMMQTNNFNASGLRNILNQGMAGGFSNGMGNAFGTFGQNPTRPGQNQARPGQNVFSSFIRTQILSDNKFPIEHPLISASALEKQPELLVGNGMSFFASQSMGMGSDNEGGGPGMHMGFEASAFGTIRGNAGFTMPNFNNERNRLPTNRNQIQRRRRR